MLADIQKDTDTHTDVHITILRHRNRGRSNSTHNKSTTENTVWKRGVKLIERLFLFVFFSSTNGEL